MLSFELASGFEFVFSVILTGPVVLSELELLTELSLLTAAEQAAREKIKKNIEVN
jgi:hypothetical protein